MRLTGVVQVNEPSNKAKSKQAHRLANALGTIRVEPCINSEGEASAKIDPDAQERELLNCWHHQHPSSSSSSFSFSAVEFMEPYVSYSGQFADVEPVEFDLLTRIPSAR